MEEHTISGRGMADIKVRLAVIFGEYVDPDIFGMPSYVLDLIQSEDVPVSCPIDIQIARLLYKSMPQSQQVKINGLLEKLSCALRNEQEQLLKTCQGYGSLNILLGVDLTVSLIQYTKGLRNLLLMNRSVLIRRGILENHSFLIGKQCRAKAHRFLVSKVILAARVDSLGQEVYDFRPLLDHYKENIHLKQVGSCKARPKRITHRGGLKRRHRFRNTKNTKNRKFDVRAP